MGLAIKGRLGDKLVERGLIGPAQLEVALNEQRRAHRPLGEIVVSLGFVRQEDLVRLLAEEAGFEYRRADAITPDPAVLEQLDTDFVRSIGAFPFAVEDGVLRVAMVDPSDPELVGRLRERFSQPLHLCVTSDADLLQLLKVHLHPRQSRVAELLGAVGPHDFSVERVTEALLVDGIRRGATDVHVEPDERVTRVRYRIDGILEQGESLPAAATGAVISRIKVLAELDIAERRRPQDGRLRISVDGRDIDMRVSIMPCAAGENAVLRILDRARTSLRLTELGVAAGVQRVLSQVAERPHGLFLVTGPTGSGKTTTLYAMLALVDAMRRNVCTIEDPIEYRMPLLRQSQVDPSIGFGFQQGLRALLRQDPDVILVGEIRDLETADMAVKASMTGHLVLSTLHTNSAVGAIPRLTDIGIEPFLLEDSLIGVLAQRLVRRVCPDCARAVPATAEEAAWIGEAAELRRGAGCARCGGSGYSGRTALCELFLPDRQAAGLIRAGAKACAIEEAALAAGFRTLVDDGRRRVRDGATTREEVLRVCASHRLDAHEREAA
jgi:type II secretory ATPase GspE/PulE/Tfp pilus assembly ATPase PilB-like protein